ncbi:nitrile hydratase accessory protein [Thalassobaculum sp. OXR-137]|uniref:nitrile hydratase accessory protein n=1 Tax=Thalassobaculum sp. OXR-137 TaxID=3100173 RepID=UPI002AC95000|nr:nitrile hydratase accessory protein [Thalassobaculum sp. OXR-137]WPZ36003.1 nitrile hydratase accessory protein [Thalassobaculum sp. OXR-137]
MTATASAPSLGTTVNLDSLPRIPVDHDGPVFREPWEAQAFAIAVKLHETGLYTWNEWATALSDEIKAAQADGDPDLGDTYYQHWLKALEGLVLAKTDLTVDQLLKRKNAWDRAAQRAPHGEPILLPEDEED